jgi:uncharacterized protein YndB with AHSA1/START domain
VTEARLLPGGRRASLRLERHLVDPPQVVWGALTERDQLLTWFPCDVEVVGGTWKVGAAIVFRFSPEVVDLTLHGQVLAVDEPKLLSFTWGEEILRFDLSVEGTGTLMVLTDELSPGIAARNAAGWEQCLVRLARHDPLNEPSWKASFDTYAAEFFPLLGAQEGPPSDRRVVKSSGQGTPTKGLQ